MWQRARDTVRWGGNIMTKKWRRDYGEGHNIEESASDEAGGGANVGTCAGADGPCASAAPDVLDREDSSGAGGAPAAEDESSTAATATSPLWPVALYVPNLLGYLRILLSFAGLRCAVRRRPNEALNTWIAAALLDLIDGAAARRLDQCSRFGVLLDIVADNVLRTVAWVSAMMESSRSDGAKTDVVCLCAAIVICLEWTTMFCSQSSQAANQSDEHDQHWKDVRSKSDRAPPPLWVQAVFRNNFRSFPGVLAIYGLFVAPFGTYVWCADDWAAKATWPYRILSEQTILALLATSYAGRLLSAMIELWLCCEYLRGVIALDSRKRAKQKVS